MNAVAEVTTTEFDEKALQAKGLVLIDFSATWCGPCRRMAPEFEAAAEELKGQVTFLKVDVDQDPEVASRYGVQSIPNLTFLKEGKVVDTVIGAISKAAIVSRAKANL